MATLNDTILEVRANKFRDKLGISNADPIDLYKVLDELNVISNFRALTPEFSGMALKTGDFRFILININQIRARQHFTIGHELYHLFVQDNFSFMLCKAGSFDKKDREEYNADIFSSYLLMPKTGLLAWIPEEELARGGKISLSTIVRLEQLFGVSRSALLVRLAKLDLINYDEYENLYKTGIRQSAIELGYSSRLYERGSDYKVIGDYAALCKKLFEEDKISESHYFTLMMDTGVNIYEKTEEDEFEW